MALALAKLSARRDGEALRVLRGLVSLDPRCPPFRMYLGIARERTGDLDGAIADYTSALDLLEGSGEDDQMAELHLLRGLARVRSDVIGARNDLLQVKRRAHALDAAWAQKVSRLALILGEEP
jgi:hypothetical protein